MAFRRKSRSSRWHVFAKHAIEVELRRSRAGGALGEEAGRIAEVEPWDVGARVDAHKVVANLALVELRRGFALANVAEHREGLACRPVRVTAKPLVAKGQRQPGV